MRGLGIFLAFVMFIFACKNQNQKAGQAQPIPIHKLTLVAKTPDSLLTSESVLYCPSLELLFVSNINGKPLDKDGNGYISQIDKNGNIKKLYWVTGLNAPKGMGAFKGKLYVTDIDRLAIIDINNAKIDTFINIEGAKFLNDIAIDTAGNVYISDSNNDLVYKYNGDSIEVFATDLKGANGLYIKGNKLLVGCADRLAEIDIDSKQITTVTEVNTPMIDGLKPAENGYITSDWYGKVYFLDIENDTMYVMLNFPDQKYNAADIEYLPDQKLVFIPTFFTNTVEIYKFE